MDGNKVAWGCGKLQSGRVERTKEVDRHGGKRKRIVERLMKQGMAKRHGA